MRNVTKDPKKQLKLGEFFKMSKKVLLKMRDSYTQCMSDCEANTNYAVAMGGPASQVQARSFSSSSYASSDEDLRELICIASTRSLGGKVDAEILKQQQTPGHEAKVVTRSMSVAIGRIDEDKPCEFGNEVKVRGYMYPRSKSYAVRKSSA